MLTVVTSPTSCPVDHCLRASHLRMIRHLSQRWGLQILVDQATFGRHGLDDLTDDELIELHQDLHRAYEAAQEGLSLEEAGLIRTCSAGCLRCRGG